MQQDTADVMLVDPDRGFTMAFFNSLGIRELNFQELQSYIPRSQYSGYTRFNGYDSQMIIDSKCRIILMAGIHDDGNIVIRSEFRPLELSLILKDVPRAIRELVNGAIKNHLPEITPLSESWLRSNNYSAELFKNSSLIIKELPYLPVFQQAKFSAKEAFDIMQAEYGISKHDSERSVLASFCAGPCVILSIYNERAKKGFLSHIENQGNLDKISSLIFEMREDVNQPLTAHMAGGWSDTYNLVAGYCLAIERAAKYTNFRMA